MEAGSARWLRRWLCSLVVCSFAASSAGAAGEYRTVEIESLKVTIDSEWGIRTAPGYLPVRFDITNLGEARVIELIGQGSRFFRGPRMSHAGGTDVRHFVRLARGDRVRLTVPLPIFADNENIRFEIREDGRTLERFNYVSFQSKVPAAEASVLIVADEGSELGTVAPGWRRKIGAAPGTVIASGASATMPTRDFVLGPDRLPTNWLGFTSLRAVVIGPYEWEKLSDPQKSALLTWTASGGDLLFVDGNLATLFPSGQGPRGSAQSAVRGYFFGRIHLLASSSITAAGLTDVLTAAERVQDPDWALPANRSSDWGVIAARGFRLLIPGIDGVPARAYLSILIVFSLLIGPLNYWFLWRKRQQVLLVLTAPVISLMFIVLLGVYVVAGEGLGVHGRAVSFTMLDQVRKQASTRAIVSLYAAGMTPAGGLRFSRDAAVFPIGRDGTGSRDRHVLDLTDAQRFSDGVIQARSPTNFDEVVFRAARERLSFSRDRDGGVSVVNGLGAPVSALLYRVGDKVYGLAGPLPPGTKGTLGVRAAAARDVVPEGIPLAARFRHLVENQPDGSYLAFLDRSPFWEPGVPQLNERGSFHLVIGWPEGQP